jgi:hypothetical protein
MVIGVVSGFHPQDYTALQPRRLHIPGVTLLSASKKYIFL